jgi:hypothetical protein
MVKPLGAQQRLLRVHRVPQVQEHRRREPRAAPGGLPGAQVPEVRPRPAGEDPARHGRAVPLVLGLAQEGAALRLHRADAHRHHLPEVRRRAHQGRRGQGPQALLGLRELRAPTTPSATSGSTRRPSRSPARSAARPSWCTAARSPRRPSSASARAATTSRRQAADDGGGDGPPRRRQAEGRGRLRPSRDPHKTPGPDDGSHGHRHRRRPRGHRGAWQLASAASRALLEQKPPRTPAQTATGSPSWCAPTRSAARRSSTPWAAQGRAAPRGLARHDRRRPHRRARGRRPRGGPRPLQRRPSPRAIDAHPRITRVARRGDGDPRAARPVVLATGPLTGDALAADLARASARSTSRTTTPSRPSWPPSPSTGRRSFGSRATTRAATTPTSTARWTPESTTRPSSPRSSRPRRSSPGSSRGALLRGLPAHRGHGRARPRDPRLRADEARGPRRSAHRAAPFAVVQLRQEDAGGHRVQPRRASRRA